MGKLLKHKWLVLVIVTVVGFFIDWYTKYLADTRLTMGVPVPVIGDYLQMLLVYNRGALFGFNPQRWLPWFPVNQFFLVFSCFAIVLLLFYYRSLKKHEVLFHWGLILILPGAFGNMFDRIMHPQKGVVDFIRVGISDTLYWPIFNMADVYVTVGVGLIFLGSILDARKQKSENAIVSSEREPCEKAEEVESGSN
ncbi:Lipoprotein signal peptidase [Chitinispirillum alkaliphilum]|nr:Lipoprotein signal peptidase [Chitinispirillum alkaliphilum]